MKRYGHRSGWELTERELEVLHDTMEGLTSAESAARLVLSVETIKSRRRSILAKLGARNMAEAVAIHLRGRREPPADPPAQEKFDGYLSDRGG